MGEVDVRCADCRLGVCATKGCAARRPPQLPVALLPPFGLFCSVFSVFSVSSVVVLLVLLLRQRRTTEDTEDPEDRETRQQGPSSKQHPGDAVQRVAVRQPARACGSGRSPPRFGEPTDLPAVVRFAPAADPRAGSARFP
jgi:hypothetical protein